MGNFLKNGISPFLEGNRSSKGPFSIAILDVLDYRSVYNLTGQITIVPKAELRAIGAGIPLLFTII